MLDENEIVEDDVVVDDAPEGDDAPQGDEEDKGTDPYADLTPEQLKERLKTAEKTIVDSKRKSKPPVTTTKPPEGEDVPEWGKKLLSTEEKRQFGHAKGLSPETVDAVFKYNGGQMPTDDMLDKDPAIKAIVRDFEGRKRVARNTPQGGAQPTYKGKTYAETATDSKASPQDKQAAFEAKKKQHGVN